MDEHISDADLLAEFGIQVKAQSANAHTPRQERIISGFEDILRFIKENGHVPGHGEGKDIFERLYAVRLDRMRSLEEARILLAPYDVEGLLQERAASSAALATDLIDDDQLLAELGIGLSGQDDIRVLKHVTSAEERRAAEEIATRTRAPDFDTFAPVFEALQHDLDSGIRQTRPFELKADIRQGTFFIVGGQVAYVAEMDELFSNAQGRTDARLRVIFDNGTESNMLLRSLQRALHKDDAGRRITDPVAGPLFGSIAEADDLESGTVYVLRSKSDHPTVAAHRELIHKIGVTGGTVETRIVAASKDATYLLADVEVVATYKLFNLNRAKLEKLFHRLFGAVQLDLTINDRFGNPVRPKEWFLVPLHVIDEAVTRFQDGSIAEYSYDASKAELKRHSQS